MDLEMENDILRAKITTLLSETEGLKHDVEKCVMALRSFADSGQITHLKVDEFLESAGINQDRSV